MEIMSKSWRRCGTLQKNVSSASRSVCEGLQTVCEGSFARNVVINFKLRAWMGCIIIYYVTHIQIANLLASRQLVSQFTSHFMPHELVHDSYAFMLREPMHLRMYVYASVAKRMSHELTCEAWIDSWTGSWPGSWTGGSQSNFVIYALNCIL